MEKGTNLHTYRIMLVCFIVFIFLLVGCSKEGEEEETPEKGTESPVEEEQELDAEMQIPIEMSDGVFNSVSGWIDDETIIYVTDSSFGSDVYSYELHTGTRTLLYKSEAPIVTVLISPSREYFLVHSSPTSQEASLTVLTRSGEVLYSNTLASAEINLEWNPYDELNLLLTTFTADWDFTVWSINIEKNEQTEISLPQPFGIWNGNEQILYLDWDLDDLSITAQLKEYNVENGTSKEYLEDIYHIESLGEFFMTAAPKDTDKQMAVYRFYSQSLEEVFSYEVPHLTRYSGWLNPYYAYNQESKRLLIYEPLYATEVDAYQGGFQLNSYHLETGELEVLFEGMEHEPISCSPNGQLCLNGYYFEKLIDLQSKEIFPLVVQEEVI